MTRSPSWNAATVIVLLSAMGITLSACSQSSTPQETDSTHSGGSDAEPPGTDATGAARSDGGADPGNGGAGGGDSSKGVDRDGDEIEDALGVAVDEDGNGRADAVDLDEDGLGDHLLVDTNGDGVADGYAVDTDGDGIADQFHPFAEDIPDGKCVNEDGEIKDGPLIYLLVDRSASMFESDGPWNSLKTDILAQLEIWSPDVNIGFGSFSGSVTACVGLSEGASLAINNYEEIAQAYHAIQAPEGKAETPTALAIQQAADLLLKAPGNRTRTILLVTDGNPDFCNDPHPWCGVDATVASLQNAAGRGVITEVLGLDIGLVDPNYLDYLATAGQGSLPHWKAALAHNEFGGELHNVCNGESEWLVYRNLREQVSGFEPAGSYSEDAPQTSAVLQGDTRQLASKLAEVLDRVSNDCP